MTFRKPAFGVRYHHSWLSRLKGLLTQFSQGPRLKNCTTRDGLYGPLNGLNFLCRIKQPNSHGWSRHPRGALTCGLPKVSLVLTLFSMLYIETLLKICTWRSMFGYADDIAFLQTLKALTKSTEKLVQDLKIVKKWSINNSITFDMAKSSLQHFTISKTKIIPRSKNQRLEYCAQSGNEISRYQARQKTLFPNLWKIGLLKRQPYQQT